MIFFFCSNKPAVKIMAQWSWTLMMRPRWNWDEMGEKNDSHFSCGSISPDFQCQISFEGDIKSPSFNYEMAQIRNIIPKCSPSITVTVLNSLCTRQSTISARLSSEHKSLTGSHGGDVNMFWICSWVCLSGFEGCCFLKPKTHTVSSVCVSLFWFYRT